MAFILCFNCTRCDINIIFCLQTVFDPSNNFLRYRSVYTSRAEQLHTPTSAEESSRYSLISQHSVRSGVSSQHGDSGIEYDHDSSPPTTSPTGFQAKMSHFTFDPAKLPHDGVMVPFLVLLVKDVYFLNHAIQTVDDSGNINLEVRLRYFSIRVRALYVIITF